MNQFSELPLSSELQKTLQRNGFATPTPVQAESIPPALKGRDVVATAQTGTGKTLAFVIPMLERLMKPQSNVTPHTPSARALVLSPTRELAMQIHEAFSLLAVGTGLRAAIVVGGVSETNQLRQLRAGAQVIIATPGRLDDFMNRKLVKLSGIEVFVLDEADRMLDMGFLPTIKRIAKPLPSDRQTMLFSATIETSVAHLISDQVKNPVRIEIGAVTKPTEQVDLHAYQVDKDCKLGMLSHLLQQDTVGSFLVFAKTKHGTDRLAKKLSGTGVKTGRIHGGRTQGQRNQALAGFKNGDYRVLVATDVAARGIHVDGIAHVVNFDLPMIPEDFIHRIGRTGRAGARGIASTFYTRDERNEIKRIERTVKVPLAHQEVPENLEREVRGRAATEADLRFSDGNGRSRLSGESLSGRNHGGKGRQADSKPIHSKSSKRVTDHKPRQHNSAKDLVAADMERNSKSGKKRFSEEAFADRLSDMWTAGEAPKESNRGAYRQRASNVVEMPGGKSRGPRGPKSFGRGKSSSSRNGSGSNGPVKTSSGKNNRGGKFSSRRKAAV